MSKLPTWETLQVLAIFFPSNLSLRVMGSSASSYLDRYLPFDLFYGGPFALFRCSIVRPFCCYPGFETTVCLHHFQSRPMLTLHCWSKVRIFFQLNRLRLNWTLQTTHLKKKLPIDPILFQATSQRSHAFIKNLQPLTLISVAKVFLTPLRRGTMSLGYVMFHSFSF